MDMLDHWQAWAAGVVALVAALIGAGMLYLQIRETREQETERHERRYRAARAVLPLSLSKIGAHERRIAAELRLIYARMKDKVDTPLVVSHVDQPFDSEVIAEFKELVEVSPPDIGNAVARLLQEMQVQAARLEDLASRLAHPEENVVLRLNIEDELLDAAHIHARAASMFKFARQQSESVPLEVDKSAVESALQNMGFWPSEFPDLHNRAATHSMVSFQI